jgi:hypothetical protein
MQWDQQVEMDRVDTILHTSQDRILSSVKSKAEADLCLTLSRRAINKTLMVLQKANKSTKGMLVQRSATLVGH